MQSLPKPERNGRYDEVPDYKPEYKQLPKPMRLQMLAPQEEVYSTGLTQVDRGRVIIFIDGANLFYAALNLGIEIDYSKLLVRLAAGGRLVRAYFYTGVDPTNEKQQGFLLWMRRNGFRVVTKDLIQFPDGSKKASLEVKIAVDMIMLANCCDTLVLLSGDGDLSYAVETVTYRGTRVEVFSLRSMSSDHLINVADTFIDLESIKQDIQKG